MKNTKNAVFGGIKHNVRVRMNWMKEMFERCLDGDADGR